jgi:hypothetical protein
MAAQESLVDLEVIKTDTKTWRLVVTDANKSALPIKGYLFFFTVKSSFKDKDEDALISKTITCPDDDNSSAGIAFISLSSEDTDIDVGNYVYDIKMQKNDNGNIALRKTIATGNFRVNVTGTQRTS